ncbi:BMP family lipoprotein [Bacillus kexueae]|uniref:BMP family lipoprotein n=1 Tax=Aeribacillus kexueae TaxID=2078952 RepID=UPI001FAEE66A|nr:BMP family ABC transporter substrate-binding protein [Bacillus kexueae]
MRKLLIMFMTAIIVLVGCSNDTTVDPLEDKVKIGIMLSDVGLGDQSFSDAAFRGLMKARDELDVIFDYREISETGTYEQGLIELVEQGNDIVIGLGFLVQEDLEKVAKQYPDQKFVLIDSVSELSNVTSLTFKEDEGSYLTGVLAALVTKSNKLGFIGGMDMPLIHKFRDGFVEGAKSVNPDVEIAIEFAGDFGNPELGAKIGKEMIDNGADVLYAAAGFTGVGMLKEAEKRGVYGIGVDSDQYYYAEKAVITSMLKNVDVGVYNVVKQFVEEGEIAKGQVELGIREQGVQLAPIRVITLTPEQEKKLQQVQQQLANE